MMSYDVGDVGRACVRTMAKLDYTSNNIANVSTPGFKAEYLNYIMKDSGKSMSENVPSYSEELATDYSQGTLHKTDNLLDFALQGEGFFVVQTNAGLAYTRKGDFTLNANNELVAKSGDFVMGKSGKITLPDKDIIVDESGIIKNGENQVDQLKIVNFENRQVLTHAGEGLFKDQGNGIIQKEFNSKVINGALEISNVNAIKEMIQMIDLQRTYETYQKLIHAIDDQDKLATGKIGKVG
jgi:flagellar basal-body rod protein FlgG